MLTCSSVLICIPNGRNQSTGEVMLAAGLVGWLVGWLVYRED